MELWPSFLVLHYKNSLVPDSRGGCYQVTMLFTQGWLPKKLCCCCWCCWCCCVTWYPMSSVVWFYACARLTEMLWGIIGRLRSSTSTSTSFQLRNRATHIERESPSQLVLEAAVQYEFLSKSRTEQNQLEQSERDFEVAWNQNFKSIISLNQS